MQADQQYDIAIVGMACRFPGARNYHEYWQNLMAGRNCIREIPPDRWDWRQYFGDPRVEPNKTTVKWGGFIDDIDKFDPLFFGIAPNEAAFIDPQHRLFLETAWHAVEDAGYSIGSLSGKKIGVYAGVSKNDYSEAMREGRYEIAPYISTGTVHSILVNRVSFLFNLHGKSEAVDTACSSSLVALHNAIRDIANGECEAALVGGVNAMIAPTMFISHTKSGMLSPDGQCKTFSADANGYVRSEGVGVLLIKPLERALRDGDHIHAVIKSSAINHGGRANFLTSPTTEAQAAVVMAALRRGNIDPRSVSYIEAHGTGTPLGDPIEINGLKKAFAELAREFPEAGETRPHCALSSAKTNVGHLESAAGMAGMIKVILAMKHRQIPAIRNFTRLNPYIELDGSPFYIATQTVAWGDERGPRRAGVSSFGMGGVNAHVVLEEAPHAGASVDGGECVVPLSAKKGRLKAYAESLIEHLTDRQARNAAPLALRDLAYTLQCGRDAFDERVAVVAGSVDELIARLGGYVGGTAQTPGVFVGEPRANDAAAPAISAAAAASMSAAALAECWAHGAKVDWSGIYGERPACRVPLPTYPFARKRCWFTDVAKQVAPVAAFATNDGSRTLRPADFFIRDHVVQGKPMLPAVVHLELARAAASPQSAESARVLSDVYWMTPVVVEGGDVKVELRLAAQGERTTFEIVQNGTIHSKGTIADRPRTAHDTVDLEAIRSRCSREVSKTSVYALLREHGLAYGSSFQAIERCAHNEREIVAELRLPAEVRDSREAFVLQPSIMDGVFQAVTALSVLGLGRSDRQFVPFHLESAEVVNRTAEHCFVHATVSEATAGDATTIAFHATLTDERGNVLVSIRNLQKRPIGERRETKQTSRDLYYRPIWQPRELARSEAPNTLVVFAHDSAVIPAFQTALGASAKLVTVRPGEAYSRLSEDVYEINPHEAADYEALLQALKADGIAPTHVAYLWADLDRATVPLLHFTQAAFKARVRDGVKLVYVYRQSEALTAAVHAMPAGFARTLKYENPNFDYVTVCLDDAAADDLARIVCAELASAGAAPMLREIAYREGRRYERTIVRADVTDPAMPFRRNGVYVITGGAGGLGFVFSRHLAEKYGATVVWLGRSPQSSAITEKAAAIAALGGRCDYFSVDITDREAVAKVVSQIKATHGDIHGVIHAAGLIEDAFILRKQASSFARVIEPKVLGALNLDALTAGEPLDFFVVFSSIASLMPNQGQCDYAAANSFLDGFAEARNRLTARQQRSGVTLAINWPLWANGGIRVSAEEERHLEKAFGMSPLPTADGLKIFEAALAHAAANFPAASQIIAIDGDQTKIERSLGVEITTNVEARGIDAEIKAIFAARLGIRPEAIDGGRTIGELGIDSSTVLGVTQDINKRFDADLKPTLLFDINTVDKLSAYLTGIGKDRVAVPAAEEPKRWNRSLIDIERSDPARLAFRKTFQTSAFYLRDHVVDEQYNVPGACYVEMARQAGELLPGGKAVRKLLNNYWASPLSSPREDFTAHVQIAPKQDRFAYEIFSLAANGEKRLHAMGEMIHGESASGAEKIDLAAVTARCTETQYPARIYEQIHGEGLMVGTTFQPMQHIVVNDDEALAVLELPAEIASTVDDYVLNPALLTGAFQAALIGNRRSAGNRRQYIPIGMDELEIFAPIPAECWIYSRPRSGNARNEEMKKFDVDVCRPDGVVVVSLKGFAIRALKEAAASARTVEATSSAAAGDALLTAVHDLIKSKLAGPIGLAADEIDVSVPFDQYGVTSIMVVELNQSFEEILGPIPKTLFFEYRNIAELAEYFVEHHREALAKLAVRTAVPKAAPAETIAATPADAIDRTEDVHAFLRSLIARPIGLGADEIDVRTGFDQYGVNSVMVVELNEIFESIFGPLSKTLFFEYRSVEELAQYFLETHRDKLLAALPSKESAPAVVAPDARAAAAHSRIEVREPAPAVDERQDIAIVSAAGRFPGARNLNEFWQVLRDGRDCITEIPPDRFDLRKYYTADPEQNGIYGKWGGFLDDVDCFDPGFFNISPREAELTDPQERLLLEVVWEMLEHGGYTRERLLKLSGRRVGVFVGALWQPYESAGVEATLSGNVVGPSSLLYSVANRISYFFDLAGPSMAIDTACSSSLTALHLACQSIRDGESQFAIVGGVNLSLTASKYLFLSRNRFLSTDGRCRAYGAGGDGYVPGEGICALLLKPLANAIADADSILGVIKGSAVNHGGRTNGYTVPNPRAQGNVIARALEQSRVDPRTITYIEGHGTGTSLGDPIEIDGLEKALGLSRDGDRHCAIGSVKSNIGHLEAAAGAASMIKVLLQMQNGQLAPSLHAATLNPNINFEAGSFRVQRELEPWPAPRCAGVSSFGAGGSNAHVILEQYDGPAAPSLAAEKRTGPALFVFSARTEERLLESIARFDEVLRDTTVESLHDVAHTLQLGREAMRERLAVVASSVGELRAALGEVAQQRERGDHWRRGRAANAKGQIRKPAAERLEPQHGRDDLLRLAEAWVQGAEIDWTPFYGGRSYRFLPLPTYPFAKERYWLDVAPSEVRPAEPAAMPVLHPLLHRNTSNLDEQRYSSTFTGDEFFLIDHQVQMDGRTLSKVLPGVVCLEMARAAVEDAVPARPDGAALELHNTVWAQPIVVDESKQLHVALSSNGNGRIDYRIYSEEAGREIVHCQGRASWNRDAEPVQLDVERLERQMRRGTAETSSIYAAFVRRGGVYGPSLQGISTLHEGSGELLAHLQLPKPVGETLADYVLHPSLMDSALQCYIGLMGGVEGSHPTRMPFAMESLRVVRPCTRQMAAWMRYAPGTRPDDEVVKLDVDLCDEQGRVCVRMRGFATRALKASEPAKKTGGVAAELLTLAPVWDPVVVSAGPIAGEAGERVVVIGGDDEQHRAIASECPAAEALPVDPRATIDEIAETLRGGRRIGHIVWILPRAEERDGDALIAGQEEGVLFGFRLVKALLREAYGAGELAWTIVTNEALRIAGRSDDRVEPAHAAVHGFAGSLAKEYRNWTVRLADVGCGEWPWNDILRLEPDDRGDCSAYREGQWYRRRLVECELKPVAGNGGFKRRGVYVVIGGAGGVGEVLSEYLIRTYDARLAWIGRREPNAEIAAKQERVAAGGGERPFYAAADARNREELERACATIQQRLGRIDGVVHSAIVLADKSVANMTEEQFRAALSTKVDTAVRIAEVFGREPLDFVLYFSSLQSFLKAPGQSNYAAGCTFADAFAEWQAADAAYDVKVMNWGYWANVGIVTATEHQERMARLGWGSLEPADGMRGIEQLLAGPVHQLGMMRTNGSDAVRALGVDAGARLSVANNAAPSLAERLAFVAAEEPVDELRTWDEQRRAMDELLVKLLFARVQATSGVSSEYDRWLKESLRILIAHGYLEDDGRTAKRTAVDEEHLWREWDVQKRRWPAMTAYSALVEATLRSLGPILRGEKRATDVMFPGSSLALVEGVYKHNTVSDHFNRAMANVVRRYVEERRKSGTGASKLRLLELGAGTGGSSEGILRTLDAYRADVLEYCYSDVSKWFLLHGEQTYGAGRDYLAYAVVDVEKGLEEQGIELGAYDVVLAANVLHATKNIRQTVRNAKAALKQNGILVLNELATKSVYMHLTFGLLSGWWAYEDEELRMEGNPCLAAETWERVLEEEGFRSVWYPAQDAHAFGQQIVVAESDGVIRHKSAVAVTPRVHASDVAAAAEVKSDCELPERVEAWLVDAIGVLLKVKKENVDVDAELSEFGFDSISLTGFANHVNHAFGLELMPTVFFEHPTVRSFTKHLVATHSDKLAAKLAAKLAPAPQSRRSAEPGKVEQWLVDAVCELLKVKRANVDVEAELSEFGFDSISLTGLANHVNRAFGLELMPTVFFEHPTVRSFARHLLEKHGETMAAKFSVAIEEARPERDERPIQPRRPARIAQRFEEAGATDSAAEPIAIIGMSGRFPGAEDLDAFWENLKAGKESVREVPRERWDWRTFAAEGRGAKWGAFIDGVDQFDPLFFGISPREAERIDPQHRLTMMYGWKAFEDAGYGPKQLWGSRTGVFVGTTSTGYGELLFTSDGSGIEGYTATGLVPSVGPNRLSYLLNLHGPSEPIETACSSSLVAVHRAVRSMRAGECEMALVGGVNTLFPTLHISFYKAGMLSPDGKCKTFSSRADGYARGEGVGMVVLKTLSAAERDGDHIYALIRGSAENHGGRAQSLTAPNPNAQADLIKDAYRRAGVSPASVSYIEAHGTGTPLGDPVEVNGLKIAFQGLSDEMGERPAASYCGLGSVKTNIGHLELAAGVAGLIKLVLQLKHRTLVQSLHCEEINPYIRLEESPFYVVRENRPWTRPSDGAGGEWPLRAGVSSFGFGGVNAHVLVEEYTGAQPVRTSTANGPAMVVLSAKDGERLKEHAAQLRQWIARGELHDRDLAGVAYTLQVGREAMDHRLAIAAASVAELASKLDDVLAGNAEIDGVYRGEVKRNNETLAVFRDDEELREAVSKWMQRGKAAKVLELWVKGLETDWEPLYRDAKPQRVSLPTYPFAKERCWVDAPVNAKAASAGATISVLHPLLHGNTSDLREQRYSSTFTGEEVFLRDHRVRTNGGPPQRVLPGVAYLEMARAAMEQASPVRADGAVVELNDVVWLKPVVVTEPAQVSIALSADEDDRVSYEVYSLGAGERTIHCQGVVSFAPHRETVKVDLERLTQQMEHGRIEASSVRAIWVAMGIEHGAAHQGIVAVHAGETQVLAQLRLPAEAGGESYVLHPSLLDSALQASIGLFIDPANVPAKPLLPFALRSLRILAPCTREMAAWIRYAPGSDRHDHAVRIDIDLCDRDGNVCVELHGLAARVLDGDARSALQPATDHRIPVQQMRELDDAFYESLIADIANQKISVEDAIELSQAALLSDN